MSDARTEPRFGPARWWLGRRGIILAALLPFALSVAASAQEATAPGFEYVLYIGRGPDRRWYECKRVAPDTAFVTDPDVAGYYPYRFSRGDEHYVILTPTDCMPLYWLSCEKRYANWIGQAAGELQRCNGLLVELERKVGEQRGFLRRFDRCKPHWEEALEEAKVQYLSRFQVGTPPAALDVLERWQELSEDKQKLTGEEEAEPPATEPDEEAAEGAPPSGGLAGPELPRIAYLNAEGTPNDKGVHVTLRWPIDRLDMAERPQAPKEAPDTQPPPTERPKRRLAPEEEEELEGIEAELDALRTAHRYATYLKEAEARVQENRDELGALRDNYLGRAATFALIHHLVESESRVHLAPVLGVQAEEITPGLVEERMPELQSRLERARRRAEADHADAAAHDAFDEISYACHLAGAYVERAQKRISLDQIETDVLWHLGDRLEGADLGEQKPLDEWSPLDGREIGAVLARSRDGGMSIDADLTGKAQDEWEAAEAALDGESSQWKGWVAAKVAELEARLRGGPLAAPGAPYFRHEVTRTRDLAVAAAKRLKDVARLPARRSYYFRIGAAAQGQDPSAPFALSDPAGASPSLVDFSAATNLAYAVFFMGAVLGMIAYVHRKPDVFVRRIAGLEAVDEAIGRATEMGKPALFVHGLTGVSNIAVLASLSILGRLARRIAEYDSDLLVVNNDPIVYSVSYEVVQQGYNEAGRPDGFKPDNVFMAASRQFPYVAAVAGIMARRRPAANFFMGYFFAESLILAEAGAMTGAIQIAATDSFTQLPFFVTTCDYTLMGEELYAASAYLSREPKMLATIKAQDLGKSLLLAVLPVGTFLGTLGTNILQVIFTAYEKGG